MFIAEDADGFTSFVLLLGLVGLCFAAIPGALALKKGQGLIAAVLFVCGGLGLLLFLFYAYGADNAALPLIALPAAVLWVALLTWSLILKDAATEAKDKAEAEQAAKDFELAEAKRRWGAKKQREASHAGERSGERPR